MIQWITLFTLTVVTQIITTFLGVRLTASTFEQSIIQRADCADWALLRAVWIERAVVSAWVTNLAFVTAAFDVHTGRPLNRALIFVGVTRPTLVPKIRAVATDTGP